MSESKPHFGQPDIVRFSDEDASAKLLERAITGLWEVVNQLTRFRRTTRENYRVTIFGSARLKPGTFAYDGVKQLAAALTTMGCELYNTPLILVGKMWSELVEWGRLSMLREGQELANAVDFTIPHCVDGIEETIALIRSHRDEWLRAQAAAKESVPREGT